MRVYIFHKYFIDGLMCIEGCLLLCDAWYFLEPCRITVMCTLDGGIQDFIAHMQSNVFCLFFNAAKSLCQISRQAHNLGQERHGVCVSRLCI